MCDYLVFAAKHKDSSRGHARLTLRDKLIELGETSVCNTRLLVNYQHQSCMCCADPDRGGR